MYHSDADQLALTLVVIRLVNECLLGNMTEEDERAKQFVFMALKISQSHYLNALGFLRKYFPHVVAKKDQ